MTNQDKNDVEECATSCAKAPSCALNLYDETIPTMYMMRLVYRFTDIIKKVKAGKLSLDIPDDYKIQNLDRFLENSIDFSGPEFKDEFGTGLSFYDMDILVQRNREALLKAFGREAEGIQKLVQRMRQDLESRIVDGVSMSADTGLKKIFLTHHRSIQRRVACVYTVINDTTRKQIIVSFRGSQGFLISTRDWQTNFNALPTVLWTPDKIKDKMQGILKTRLLVHKGLSNYLFSNKYKKGDQRYDEIVADIRAVLANEKIRNNEKGSYSVYVTGHSLGGALATMFSLKLAGAGKSFDDIPRPITCITWAALFSGTRGYRTAMEHLERGGFIRHLRITIGEDIVPTVPPFSFFRLRLMKHTGINLRMNAEGCRIEHSSIANFWTAVRNSMFKPIWCLLTWHSPPLHERRFDLLKGQLEGMKLDDLYKDETVVSKDFIEGNIS